MWDEYDEGTQFLPAITNTADLPEDESGKFRLIACDIDGYDVPPDWYMRIAGYGSSLVKNERNNEDRFPEKVLREWESNYEVRPVLQTMHASGSGHATTGTNTQRSPYRTLPRRVALARDVEDPPPPPYTRDAEATPDLGTLVSPGPEQPISTRPDIHSRPPPPVPPRPSSQAGLSPGPGVAPAIPLASRPSASPPPLSPHSPGLPAGYQPSSLHHLSANQPAPRDYPHHMPMPQILSGAHYQIDGSVGGPNSYTSPAAQVTIPQPGNPWYPQTNTRPSLPNQYWNNPNEMAPAHPPPSGQHLGVYSYEGGYDNSFTFPEATRSSNYRDDYSMPQTPPILEPQRLNPGPPSLTPLRKSPASMHLR